MNLILFNSWVVLSYQLPIYDSLTFSLLFSPFPISDFFLTFRHSVTSPILGFTCENLSSFRWSWVSLTPCRWGQNHPPGITCCLPLLCRCSASWLETCPLLFVSSPQSSSVSLWVIDICKEQYNWPCNSLYITCTVVQLPFPFNVSTTLPTFYLLHNNLHCFGNNFPYWETILGFTGFCLRNVCWLYIVCSRIN